MKGVALRGILLRGGQTVEEIATLLAFIMGRHQSLRTRFRLGNDGEPSRLRWGKKSNTPAATCYLNVNAVPNTVDLTLRVDTHRVTPEDLVKCLRGIEEVVVDAALPSRLA